MIHNPVRKPSDVDRLRELEDVGALDFVYEAIRQTRRALKPDIPLIGFCGAPFTLASYMIEGGGSKNYVHTKTLDVQRPRRLARDDVADSRGVWRSI